MLRFVVDESAGRAVTDWLRAAGHDAIDVTATMPQADDADILSVAAREQRIVVTNDKDFGELVFHSGRTHAGILLFRLDDESAVNRVRMVRFAVERYGDQLAGCFTVVTEKTIRIRPKK